MKMYDVSSGPLLNIAFRRARRTLTDLFCILSHSLRMKVFLKMYNFDQQLLN
jgi:hypothetical protein